MNPISILCQRYEVKLNDIARQSRVNRERAWALHKQLETENYAFVEKLAKAVGYATEEPGNWRRDFWRYGVSERLSPDQRARFVLLTTRARSIAKNLIAVAESHLATLCDAYEDTLHDSWRELSVSPSDMSPEQVWISYDKFADATNVFLNNFAIAVDYENHEALHPWDRGVPRQFSVGSRTRVPELGRRASLIKNVLAGRASKLIPPHVNTLCDTCQRRLDDIPQKSAAIQQPSLASLRELRRLDAEIDAVIDAFLEDLAKALHYTTEGPKWQWQKDLLRRAVPRRIPDQQERIFELKTDASSIKNDLHARVRELLRPHVDTLCRACRQGLNGISQKLAGIRQPSLASLQRLRTLGEEVDVAIDSLLEDLAKALQYTTEGSKFTWQKNFLAAVPRHFPDQQERIFELKTDASSIKNGLHARVRELLPPHVDILRDICQRGFDNIQQKLASIRQPSLANLQQLRELDNEVDDVIDAFFEDLAKALHYTTEGPKSRWQGGVRDTAVPRHIPDQQERVLALTEGASSVKNDLKERRRQLLRQLVDILRDTCQRRLNEIPQKMAAIQRPSLANLQQLRKLENEVDAVIDAFLEDLAKALHHTTEGPKWQWQKNLVRAVPRRIPDQQERVLELKTDASSIKNGLHARVRELLRPHVDSLCDTCQRGLDDIQKALAAIQRASLDSLLQLRQLDNEVDAAIDAFLDDLAKALHYKTEGRKSLWQSNVRGNAVPRHIPDQQERVLALTEGASSVKNDVHQRIRELLRSHVDSLRDTCRRRLNDIQQKLAAIQPSPVGSKPASLEQLQQLDNEVDAVIETFLEDLAKALNRKSEGPNSQSQVLNDAVLPNQQEEILQLKADASSLKSDLAEHARKLRARERSVRPSYRSGTESKIQPDIRYYRRAQQGYDLSQGGTVDVRQGTTRKPKIK